MYLLSKFTHVALDRLAWSAARSAVDAVRFQPAHTKLLMACSASQADGPQRWVSGAAAVLARPRVARLLDLPHLGVRAVAGVVERHRGLVFQYTGDGLLALFIAELAGGRPGAMLDRLVNEMCPLLHREFDALHERWRADWQAAGRPAAEVGLGAGLSFGRVTMGYIGAYGKKQFAALGEPVNLAALLCADAEAGTVLIDRGSFERAGFEPLRAKTVRLRSRKLQ